jgi:hypothetical protein
MRSLFHTVDTTPDRRWLTAGAPRTDELGAGLGLASGAVSELVVKRGRA